MVNGQAFLLTIAQTFEEPFLRLNVKQLQFLNVLALVFMFVFPGFW